MDAHADGDPARGEKVFQYCYSCHSVQPGETNLQGPNLLGIVGRRIASQEGFTYSPALRAFAQQDLWHYTVQKMVDACLSVGIKPFYGPFGDFADLAACESQFRNSFLQGCLGAWSLHPTQIDIAKRVFSLDPAEVAFAKRIVEAMPDGSGAVMIDGKMQDDATWKQAKVILDLARLVAARDPDRKALYGL